MTDKLQTDDPLPKGPVGAPLPMQPLRPPVAPADSAGLATRPKRPDQHDELRLLINSRHPIITVETSEEQRVEVMLVDVAAELDVPLHEWSVTTGLARAHGAQLYHSDNPEQALSNIALIQGDGIFLPKDNDSDWIRQRAS